MELLSGAFSTVVARALVAAEVAFRHSLAIWLGLPQNIVIHVVLPFFLSEPSVFSKLRCEGRGWLGGARSGGGRCVLGWTGLAGVAGVLPLSLDLSCDLFTGVSQAISKQGSH